MENLPIFLVFLEAQKATDSSVLVFLLVATTAVLGTADTAANTEVAVQQRLSVVVGS